VRALDCSKLIEDWRRGKAVIHRSSLYHQAPAASRPSMLDRV
jgi:hypothetical protein